MIELHSTPVAIALVVGIVALSAITGYLFGVARSPPDDAHGESTGGETASAGDGSEVEAAGERYGSAVEHFSHALKACEGARQPAGRLAATVRATATAFRECHRWGSSRAGRRVDAGSRAPWELRRDGPRLAISAWQPFDRSFATMLATLDDPGADLRAYVTVFDRLADAAEAGAAALHDSDMPRSRRARSAANAAGRSDG